MAPRDFEGMDDEEIEGTIGGFNPHSGGGGDDDWDDDDDDDEFDDDDDDDDFGE